MRIFNQFVQLSLLSICLVGFTGCGSATDTKTADAKTDAGDGEVIDAGEAGLSTDDLVSLDEPDLPDNYNDAVGELGELATAISTGFENDKIDDAHGPLHEIGKLLKGITTLAKNSSMPDDAKKAIEESVDQLFESYNQVDLKLHNAEKGKDYADVSDSIKAAMKTLQGYVKE